MSRRFDGVDDQMVYPVAGPTGAYTLLILVKIIPTADNTWLSFLELESGAGALITALGRSDAGLIYSYVNGTQDDIACTDSDGWMLVAVTKVAGTTAPIVHKLVIGGAATHTAVPFTTGNPPSASTVLRIGGNDDFANILVGAAAVWIGTAVSNANLEAILAAKTTQSIADLSPTWLVDDSDAFATDLIGTADRSSIVGTADDADDASGWVYGLGGGGPVTVNPDTGLVTLTGLVPAVSLIARPGQAVIALTGIAPTGRVVATPAAAVLTASGLAPAATVTARPTPGVLTASGAAATAAVVARPDAGLLTASGLTPTPAVVATPDVGTLVASGLAPTTTVTARPSPGVVELVGFPPSLAGNVIVSPDVGIISLAGLAPSTTITARPSAGVLTAVGFAPAVSVRTTPAPATLTLVGLAPTVTIAAAPSPATLTLTAFAPTTSLASTPTPGLLTLSGFAPSFTGEIPPASRIVAVGVRMAAGGTGSTRVAAGAGAGVRMQAGVTADVRDAP